MVLLKISSFDDNLEIILLMDFAICVLILSGWLKFISMYIRLLLARVKSINKATKKFAQKLKITDKMECMDELEAYITIKNHNKKFLKLILD